MTENAYIGLGSNLGDSLASLRAACVSLHSAAVIVQRCSSVYRGDPIGPVAAQPPFYNAVVEVTSTLSPQALLQCCLAIEHALGRVRVVPQGPRVIDLDLLLFGCHVGRWRDALPHLTLPHPQLCRRRFVLEPLLELSPHVRDPRDGTPLKQYLAALQETQRLERIAGQGDFALLE